MMMMRSIGSRARTVGAVACLTACAALPAAAQQPSDPIGRGLAAATRAAVARSADTTAAVAPDDGQDPAPAAPAADPTLKFFSGTELSGFVDTYYAYNFNKPATACATAGGVAVFNCLHNFDAAHNSFSLSLAELALEKKPTKDSRGGFRIDLDYGSTASMVAAFEPGGTTIYQNIQQAYLSYLAPVGNGSLQVDFGKFVTPAGFEVIESKDNWNYSRGLLFSLAIPYYHMGMRAAYSPTDKITLTGFLFNGWNNTVDNNTGKSFGISFTAKPNDKFTFIENYIAGPETTGTNTPWRNLSDTVLTYTLNKKTSLAFNYDWAKDGDNQVQGVALYLKYQANDWFAVTPRYEFFNDRDGFTTTMPQNLNSFTLTTEFKHKDGVLMRIEYRGDFSDKNFFIGDTPVVTGTPPALKKGQNELLVGWIFAFSSKTP